MKCARSYPPKDKHRWKYLRPYPPPPWVSLIEWPLIVINDWRYHLSVFILDFHGSIVKIWSGSSKENQVEQRSGGISSHIDQRILNFILQICFHSRNHRTASFGVTLLRNYQRWYFRLVNMFFLIISGCFLFYGPVR